MSIIVSSCAFQTSDVDEMIDIARMNGLILEFSSGIKYSPNLKEKFMETDIPRFLHNYFPPPKNPFVINLASTDEVIRSKSVRHCIQGLQLARATGSSFFSAHAGFCIDVKPKHLGNPFPRNNQYNRDLNMSLFIDSLRQILNVANEIGMIFCIENNVVANFNISSKGTNPFLCADSKEINYVFDKMKSDNLGLLFDTGHFKVSSNSLKFDLLTDTSKISDKIYAVHHNDNDGLTDTNMQLPSNYWFAEIMDSLDPSVYHVLEVKNIPVDIIKSQINFLNSKI